MNLLEGLKYKFDSSPQLSNTSNTSTIPPQLSNTSNTSTIPPNLSNTSNIPNTPNIPNKTSISGYTAVSSQVITKPFEITDETNNISHIPVTPVTNNQIQDTNKSTKKLLPSEESVVYTKELMTFLIKLEKKIDLNNTMLSDFISTVTGTNNKILELLSKRLTEDEDDIFSEDIEYVYEEITVTDEDIIEEEKIIEELLEEKELIEEKLIEEEEIPKNIIENKEEKQKLIEEKIIKDDVVENEEILIEEIIKEKENPIMGYTRNGDPITLSELPNLKRQ